MSDIPQTIKSVSEIHMAGVIALVTGVISAIGVVLLIAMFALFAARQSELGNRVGWLNDICVALQYLLTIPIALALRSPEISLQEKTGVRTLRKTSSNSNLL